MRGPTRWGRRLVAAVRNDRRVRRVASTAVDAVVRRGPVAGVRGGGGETESPLVLVVVLGAAEERVERLARRLAELQAVGEAFRPMFLLDAPSFAPARRYGYVAEYVSREPAWPRPLADRVGEMRAAYAPAATVVLAEGAGEAADGAALAVIVGVAGSSPSPPPNRLARLRRWVDRSG